MNSNPIDIEIKKIQSPFNIELNSIEDFDGNQKESQSNEKNNCSVRSEIDQSLSLSAKISVCFT